MSTASATSVDVTKGEPPGDISTTGRAVYLECDDGKEGEGEGLKVMLILKHLRAAIAPSVARCLTWRH